MKPLTRSLKVISACLLFAAFAVALVEGKPEYAKKEGTGCVTCHVKNGSKELNDVGACYKEKKSLKDCTSQKKK